MGCVSPVVPEFDFIEGVVFIDALASTAPETSFVNIFESVAISNSNFTNKFIEGADVFFRNIDTNDMVRLTDQESTYLPPEDFVAGIGESWELLITLPDGRRYQSTPDRVIKPVAIQNIRATFNPDLKFRPSSNDFVPGHSVSIDLEDPAEEDNFYFWTFRSFENLVVCETCEGSIFRNGVCEDNPPNVNRLDFYDYECDSNCWFMRSNEDIRVFSDEFSNGSRINALPVADVLLYTRQDIVIQLQQFSLSESAYEYYNILEDIVQNNGSINAPPPAALIGNMFNPDDATEFVLGRFTASASSSQNIFIDRTSITQRPLENEFVVPERCLDVCPPINCAPFFEPGCAPVTTAPCGETRFRTNILPDGFIIQEEE